jgi:PDZ domain-containing protein
VVGRGDGGDGRHRLGRLQLAEAEAGRLHHLGLLVADQRRGELDEVRPGQVGSPRQLRQAASHERGRIAPGAFEVGARQAAEPGEGADGSRADARIGVAERPARRGLVSEVACCRRRTLAPRRLPRPLVVQGWRIVETHQDDSVGSHHAEEGEDVPPWTWRRWHTALAVLAVVVIAAVVASLVNIPYYAITPGQATSVEALIGLPKSRVHLHRGQFLLVDVELTPLKAIEWPYFALDPNAQIVGSSEILGPANPAQYQIEGELDMSNAQQAATVVALGRLGYKVAVHNDGSLVYALLPSSPAAQSLAVGQVIVGVGGKPVLDYSALGPALARYRPGDTVSMRVLSWPSRRPMTVRIRVSAWRVKGRGRNATYVCPVYGSDTRYPLYRPRGAPRSGAGETCIGVSIEPNYRVGRLPFRIDLSSEGIIGPSAGLAFTLGLIERLDPYDLSGGHRIAATGTMNIYGDVGPVGGVAQKTVAVRDAGAKVFFVPPAEYKVALAHAGSSLKVYPVSTVAQAIHILVTRYGGKLPPGAPAS